MRASQHPEAAFLATMTASATHEVRNVLAIIKESAGLIEDLMHVCAKRGTLDQEKVARAVHRIESHVQRGADLLTNLNRLSRLFDSFSLIIPFRIRFSSPKHIFDSNSAKPVTKPNGYQVACIVHRDDQFVGLTGNQMAPYRHFPWRAVSYVVMDLFAIDIYPCLHNHASDLKCDLSSLHACGQIDNPAVPARSQEIGK